MAMACQSSRFECVLDSDLIVIGTLSWRGGLPGRPRKSPNKTVGQVFFVCFVFGVLAIGSRKGLDI